MCPRRSRKKVQADKPEVSASGLSNVPAMTVSQYISKFKVPDRPLIYSPVRGTSYTMSGWGEDKVQALLNVSTIFAVRFDKIFPVDVQQKVAREQFEICKKEYEEAKKANPETSKGKKYFETNRRFYRLVPSSYRRTKAPRLTTDGNTFHSMNKVLLLKIASDLAKKKNVVFVDIDMGAAHSRIACFLNRGFGKFLEASLKDPNFWGTQVKKVKPIFEKAGISRNDGEIKKILKVGLYSSLNGGNPSSDNRIMENMKQNAGRYLKIKGINENDAKALQSDSLFFAIRYAFEGFALIQEVRDLNQRCCVPTHFPDKERAYMCYSVDRSTPYFVESQHKAISRVLQGFEVVMLAALVADIFALGGIPASLGNLKIQIYLTFLLQNQKLQKPVEFDNEKFFGSYEKPVPATFLKNWFL